MALNISTCVCDNIRLGLSGLDAYAQRFDIVFSLPCLALATLIA
jgi:hypothetical protein